MLRRRSRLGRHTRVYLVIFVALAVIAGAFFGIRSLSRNAQLRPLLPHMFEYNNVWGFTKTEKNPTIVEQIIPINTKNWKIDQDIVFAIPKELRPSNPDDVQTVVMLTWDTVLWGTYTSGARGWVQTCDVEIFDMITKTRYKSRQISGSKPPSNKSGTNDWTGSKPTGKVVEYIAGLPPIHR